jgi:hypothetical protein
MAMYSIIAFSYKSQETKNTSNSIPFKIGDTLSIQGFRAARGMARWNEVNGTYRIDGIISRGYVVSGPVTRDWGDGSINIPFSYPPEGVSSVVSSGGGKISGATEYRHGPGGSLFTADWWMHMHTTTDAGLLAASNPPVTSGGPGLVTVPNPPRAVDRPPPDDGNKLNTGYGGFDIDKFIATANFKPGRDPRANARGIAAFRAEAKKAAKQAKLTTAQTKKLMDAVDRAIADGMAKAKKKPLDKIKKR